MKLDCCDTNENLVENFPAGIYTVHRGPGSLATIQNSMSISSKLKADSQNAVIPIPQLLREFPEQRAPHAYQIPRQKSEYGSPQFNLLSKFSTSPSSCQSASNQCY